jgi:tetratricopeptide (TPR) repeat protein
MKNAVLFGILTLTSVVGFAQNDSIQKRECDRMRFLAGEELKLKNFAGALTYYQKAETICGNFDKAAYERMSQAAINANATETDKVRKALFADTVISIYGRMDSKSFFDQKNALTRASFYLKTTTIDRAKADEWYTQSLKNGVQFNESQLLTYYNNLYQMYIASKDDLKGAIKKRLINDYFVFSKLVTDAGMTPKTQETLTNVFNTLIKTCDDILPDLAGFMKTLPQEKEAKIKTVNNFMTILKEKGCTGSKEYEMLVDTIIKVDNSIDAVLAKANLQMAKKRYDDAISTYRTAINMSTISTQKEDLEYEILEIVYFKKDNIRGAYNMAMGINGSKRSKALEIAADCVAKLANSCGTSTFERKCNYLYAAELAQRAGDGSKASRYRAMGPSNTEIFTEGNPSSASLSCWGVSVSLK